MIIMSLRAFGKQSPNKRGDCFAVARNDMVVQVNALRERWLSSPKGVSKPQPAGGEELRPLCGRMLTLSPSEASGMPSVLRPQGGAFKGEL